MARCGGPITPYPMPGVLSEGSYLTHLLSRCWGAEEPWKVLDQDVM